MYVYKDVKWHQENYVTVKNVKNLKEKGKNLVPRRDFCILVIKGHLYGHEVGRNAKFIRIVKQRMN